jgi:hypothetical protein
MRAAPRRPCGEASYDFASLWGKADIEQSARHPNLTAQEPRASTALGVLRCFPSRARPRLTPVLRIILGSGNGCRAKTSFGSIVSSGEPSRYFPAREGERARRHSSHQYRAASPCCHEVATLPRNTCPCQALRGPPAFLNAAAEPPHRCEHAQALHTCCCLLFLGALPSKPTCPKPLQGAKRLRCGPLKR